MGIERVTIENFTVFEHVEIDFASGVNVLIGENGTGKTHLMKAMYVLLQEIKLVTFDKCFKLKRYTTLCIDENKNIELSAKLKGVKNSQAVTFGKLSGQPETIKRYEDMRREPTQPSEIPLSVFIPAKDMLTHSRSFLSLYDKFDLPFDKMYYDIISKSMLPNLREIPEIGKSILPKLEEIIGGVVVVENETFFIQKTNGELVEFSVEAEGIKKIAILWQLIMNESITEGSVLFLDEPDANINPALYKEVTTILLELARHGVQIFLATHNYNFAKYIEVLMGEGDAVSFHALHKTETGVQCETQEEFALLSHNALREDNINLYDEEMKKEFEE